MPRTTNENNTVTPAELERGLAVLCHSARSGDHLHLFGDREIIVGLLALSVADRALRTEDERRRFCPDGASLVEPSEPPDWN